MAPTSDIRRFKDLPAAAKAYIACIEQIIGCPIDLISVGPSREQTVVRRSIF